MNVNKKSKTRSLRSFSQDSTFSQSSEKSKSNRTKNYSAEECSALIRCCDKFHAIINKTSNRDKDRIEKAAAWDKIKQDFDAYCRSNGIFVSDRSVGQLQSKYKELKKLARKELSEAKRDLVKTGNTQLRSKTVETLRDSNSLLQLRSRMGVSACGFTSKHCSDANQQPAEKQLQSELNANPGSSNYVPGAVRERRRTQFKNSVDSSTLKFGVESDETGQDFSGDEDDISHEHTEKSSSSIDSNPPVARRKRNTKKNYHQAQQVSNSNKSMHTDFSGQSYSFGLIPGHDATYMNDNIDDNGSRFDQTIDSIREQAELAVRAQNSTLSESQRSDLQLNQDQNRDEFVEDFNDSIANSQPPNEELSLDRQSRLQPEEEQRVRGAPNRKRKRPMQSTIQENIINRTELQIEAQHTIQLGPNDPIPSDEEFPIERRMRLEREEEQGGYLRGRLTAPPNEVRRRHRARQTQSANQNANSIVEALREKQTQLVDLQIELQQILIENEKIAQMEAQEKYLMARALRMNAEANAHGSINQSNQ